MVTSNSHFTDASLEGFGDLFAPLLSFLLTTFGRSNLDPQATKVLRSRFRALSLLASFNYPPAHTLVHRDSSVTIEHTWLAVNSASKGSRSRA